MNTDPWAFQLTGDGYIELQKCERVLREFVVVGVPTKEKAVDESGKQKKKTKVLKKLWVKIYVYSISAQRSDGPAHSPPSVLANAKGIVIFSAFRSGFAPLGGSGGSGVIIIRNPDRTWSAPAFIAPNNLSGGFLIGLDAFNAIIILNSDEAVQGFKSHQFTLGAEVSAILRSIEETLVETPSYYRSE
jgi:lipid-binding SYLF domain-containing protein